MLHKIYRGLYFTIGTLLDLPFCFPGTRYFYYCYFRSPKFFSLPRCFFSLLRSAKSILWCINYSILVSERIYALLLHPVLQEEASLVVTGTQKLVVFHFPAVFFSPFCHSNLMVCIAESKPHLFRKIRFNLELSDWGLLRSRWDRWSRFNQGFINTGLELLSCVYRKLDMSSPVHRQLIYLHMYFPLLALNVVWAKYFWVCGRFGDLALFQSCEIQAQE